MLRKITTTALNTSARSQSTVRVGCVHYNFIYDNIVMKDRALDKLLYSFSSILLDFVFNKLSKNKNKIEVYF